MSKREAEHEADPSLVKLTAPPQGEAKSLLLALLPSHPDDSTRLVEQHHQRLSAAAADLRAAPPKDFDYLSKSCWRELNVGHGRKSGSRQYEAAFDIGHTIEDAAKSIVSGCQSSDKPQTRQSAMETLRKISKSVLLCDHGEIRKVVMNNGTPRALAEAMGAVLEMMEAAELEAFGKGETAAGIRSVNEEMAEYGEESYTEVVSMLDGDDSSE